ncbi:MAG: LysM domain-containing protein [Deltaproteobacteria bacterium]|nr:LysM domain-containing protein [Deltaproteobacteria bacterium]
MSVRRLLLIFLCLLALGLCLGCKKKPSSQSSPATEKHLSHTIRHQGETLAIISQWYTGDPGHWRTLMNLNGIASPTALRLGQTIVIPMNLVKTSKPLPASFIKEQTRPKAQTKTQTKVQKKPKPDMAPASDAQAEPESPLVESEKIADEQAAPDTDAQTPPPLIIAPPR